MVVCHKCRTTRLVTRNFMMKPVMPKPPEEQGELVSSDPCTMTIAFRCDSCKLVYTFQRVVTSDELRVDKKSDGCGGCGP